MSYHNFFKINMPYGIKRKSGDSWMIFNQLGMPLGWEDRSRLKKAVEQQEIPVYQNFENLSTSKLKEIAYGAEGITCDDKGKIIQILFYKEPFDLRSNAPGWAEYIKRLKLLAKLEVNQYP